MRSVGDGKCVSWREIRRAKFAKHKLGSFSSGTAEGPPSEKSRGPVLVLTTLGPRPRFAVEGPEMGCSYSLYFLLTFSCQQFLSETAGPWGGQDHRARQLGFVYQLDGVQGQAFRPAVGRTRQAPGLMAGCQDVAVSRSTGWKPADSKWGWMPYTKQLQSCPCLGQAWFRGSGSSDCSVDLAAPAGGQAVLPTLGAEPDLTAPTLLPGHAPE